MRNVLLFLCTDQLLKTNYYMRGREVGKLRHLETDEFFNKGPLKTNVNDTLHLYYYYFYCSEELVLVTYQ